MDKRQAGTITFLMIALLAISGGLRAQDDAPEFAPAFLLNSADGIVFYGVNWENESAEIGRLPVNMGLNDRERNHEWRINARDNFVLSPDNQHIAFVAQKQDSGLTGLFIYDLQTRTLDEAVTVEACHEFYPPSIKWSPDSRLIMVGPGCSSTVADSRILYRLADQQRIPLPDDYSSAYWSADSSRLLYHALSDDVNLFDTERNLGVRLGNIEHLTVSPLAFQYLHVCRFVWSDVTQRWFFESGCASPSDSPMDYLYSVDLDGNARLEMSLPDFYSARFPRTESDSTYHYVDILSVVPMDSGLYLVVEVGLEQSYWSIVWYEGRFSGLMRPREVFSASDVSPHWGAIADVAFSPSKDLVALVDYDGNIKVIQLPGGHLIGEVQGGVFDNQGVSYEAHWLDDSRLVYTRVDGGIGVFYRGEYDRIDMDFAKGLDGDVLMLRQNQR
jgi:WD40 repeat protein